MPVADTVAVVLVAFEAVEGPEPEVEQAVVLALVVAVELGLVAEIVVVAAGELVPELVAAVVDTALELMVVASHEQALAQVQG